MRKYLILPFLFIGLMLYGCDPARRIEMKNKSSDTAEFIWKSREDSIGFNPFVLTNNKELKFTIPPHKNSKIKMSFGIGVWSPSEVEKVIFGIESFEILSARHKIRIDSLPQLRDYLLARRKGVGGSKIEIVITD